MNIQINQVPSPTWRWLGMNSVQLENMPSLTAKNPETEVPSGVTVTQTADTAASSPLNPLFSETPSVLHIQQTAQVKTPVYLHYQFQNAHDTYSVVQIDTLENEQLTVIMDYQARDCARTAAVQTRIRLAKNAVLRLIQVQMTGGMTFLNELCTDCAQNSRFELIQLVLDGERSYYDTQVNLSGEQAAYTADMGYLLKNQQLLDINSVAAHTGKNTASEIQVSGVLDDAAQKVFRGTIDFRAGCAGATGAEKEDVLLLDENVRNRTLPVILCEEEDVEGEHGATIGRLDEELLFYLMSRGITEEQAYVLMAQARILAISRKIDDCRTEAVIEELFGVESEQTDNAE